MTEFYNGEENDKVWGEFESLMTASFGTKRASLLEVGAKIVEVIRSLDIGFAVEVTTANSVYAVSREGEGEWWVNQMPRSGGPVRRHPLDKLGLASEEGYHLVIGPWMITTVVSWTVVKL